MRGVPDRFWYLLVFGGLVLGLETLAALGWSVLGFFIHTSWFSQDTGTFLLVAIGLCLLPLLFIPQGFLARRRFRRRVRALRGDQEAMSRAALSIDPAAIPDLTNEPLELRWREIRVMEETLIRGVMVVFLDLFMPFMELGFLRYSRYADPLPAFYQMPWLQSTLDLIEWLALSTIIFFTGFLCFVLFRRFCARPCRVIARADGLWYTPSIGRSRLLRWEEIQLCEVQGTAISRVYGAKLVIEWRTPSLLVWQGKRLTDHFAEHQQALFNLIAKRTALVPRTVHDQFTSAPGIQ